MQFDPRRHLVAATALLFAVVSQSVVANQSDLGIAAAQSSTPFSIKLPALDTEGQVKASVARTSKGDARLRYAERVDIRPITAADPRAWSTRDDGRRVWRVRVRAAGATSVELGFEDLHLPEGASLIVWGDEGRRLRGPYTADDNKAHGRLTVPIVEGDTAHAELVLEEGVSKADVSLSLTHILQGFLAFWDKEAMRKVSRRCQVDVACEIAQPWEDEIRSVGRIAFDGNLCTGTLVNNTAYDGRPLFLTAEHCLTATDRAAEEHATTATVYWNYANSFCRPPGEDDTRGRGDGSLDQAQSGATLLAIWEVSDFALMELDRAPDARYEVHYAGWDRRDRAFSGGVGLHHPVAQEMRIAVEYDPLEVRNKGLHDFPRPNAIGTTFWDTGLTQRGSSGSGLWSPDHRLLGQLSGGSPNETCDGPVFDSYGRLPISWDGDGDPGSRLKDHLDPLDTGEPFIGGMDACGLGRIEIEASKKKPTAGERVTYRAVAAEGSLPSGLSFAWDFERDGVADARGRKVATRFPKRDESLMGARDSGGTFDQPTNNTHVSLTVTDTGQGCAATYEKAVDVQEREATLVEVGDPELVCGDSDGIMEPGERWRVPVTVANTGSVALDGVRALLTRDGTSTGPTDGFGYEMVDSRSAACGYNYIWPIEGDQITFHPAVERVNETKLGYSDPLPLDGFRFYGQKVDEAVMSTNGYLSTSSEADGSDHSNDCPVPEPTDRDAVGARIMPFHGNFRVSQAWSASYEECPRPGDTGREAGGCRVFQWGEFEEDPFFGGKMPFQAILYNKTNQVVLQYGKSTPDPRVNPTAGIQNEAGTVGLMHGCKSAFAKEGAGVPSPESAVCFFAPNHPPERPDVSAVRLLEPVVDFGRLEAGEEASRTVEFQVSESAGCGTKLGLQLHGITFEGGFTKGPGVIVAGTVGGEEGVCNANASCGAAKADEIDFTRGMWFNPARDGHGIDVHTAGDTGFLVWYTYEDGHKPVWYQAVGTLRDNQIHGDLLRFSLDPGEPLELAGDCTAAHSNPRCEDVGEAMFTALSQDTGLFHWTLDGQPGGERFEVLKASSAPADRHTGHWYPPLEPGWGLTVNQQGAVEFGVLYFYDETGDPTWALGVQDDTPGLVPLDQFTGFCPSCPWVRTSGKRVGDYTRSFSTLTQGAVDVDVDLRPPLKGAWQREEAEIQMLSEPID